MTLAQDTSTITACANDYSFDQLFARSLKAFARSGDCLLGISTSGNSENVRRALEEAKTLNVKSFSFLGSGGACLGVSDLSFVVPSDDMLQFRSSYCCWTCPYAIYRRKVCGV